MYTVYVGVIVYPPSYLLLVIKALPYLALNWFYTGHSARHSWYVHPIFLALLDYASRAHEIEIRPSSFCGIDYL